MRLLVILAVLCVALSAYAEDGQLFVKNVSRTPDWDTDAANIKVMESLVPPEAADGTLLTEGVEIFDDEGALAFTMDAVQPLIACYCDGPVVHPEDSGHFPGHGNRDVYSSVSLDGGATWKQTNLSESGFRSSYTLQDGTTYFGDTFRLFVGMAGRKVCAAWASRYARGGNPNYAMDYLDKETLGAFLMDGDGENYFGGAVPDTALYLRDMFGVTGSQKSSDFADEGYPSVGEVPYACLWAARGTLEALDADGNVLPLDEDGTLADAAVSYKIFWRKAERLSSAVRDVHRIEVAGTGGAGFVITWQEDPDGLRPGEGEGPGEGWSGAIAHHETDIWYSWVDWNLFDLVLDPAATEFTPITLNEYTVAYDTRPSVAVPFAMPVRLTDNTRGTPLVDGDTYDPETDGYNYLFEDFDDNGTADLCARTVTINVVTPSGPSGDQEYCVTEDGRILRGNVGATRARVNVGCYSSVEGGPADNAWVVLAYEESKGSGEEEDLDPQGLIDKVDMGKNIYYHTFDMRNPEIVSQGLMLNTPAVYPDELDVAGIAPRLEVWAGDHDPELGYFMTIDPDPIYDDQESGAAYDTETTLFQHEISRRFSLISQPAFKVLNEPGKTVAFAMWKQGIVRRGGPADVYARRFIIPEDFDPTTMNPFDYSCMECADDAWLFTDGSNPRYTKGLCMSMPQNMTSTSVVTCDDANTGCANPLMYPFNEYFDDASMELAENGMPKIFEWSMSGPDFGGAYKTWGPDGLTPAVTSSTDNPYEDGNSFNDFTWTNPYEVAKGHRGFMRGDFIMMMYAWSPNQLANANLHDNYQLYARRSFDGGATWTTVPNDGWDTPIAPLPDNLPADFAVVSGTAAWYTFMGEAGSEEYRCFYPGGLDDGAQTAAAGEFEPGRDLSLIDGTRKTVLDPRFCGAGGFKGTLTTLADGVTEAVNPADYPTDLPDLWVRNPSVWFYTFEEGNNTVDPPSPDDMFYARCYNYGDNIEMIAEDPAQDPLDPTIEAYFDWYENKHDVISAEAALGSNPGAIFFYGIYNAFSELADHQVTDSDGMMRRCLFLDNTSAEEDGSGGGGDGGGGGGKGGKAKIAPLIDTGVDGGLVR